MKKLAWTITAIALTIGTSTAANAAGQPSKEELKGAGAGALLGAAVGGPVGFIVGAAIGAEVGESMHHKNAEIGTLDRSLEASKARVQALRIEMDDLERELGTTSADLATLERSVHPELVSLMQSGISLDLLFRTDEFELVDGARLSSLAASLAAMPEVRVHLDGFADERGDSDYNQALSEKRVLFVRDHLVEAGIEPSRISAMAHGETAAADQTEDSFALERRVSLRVYLDGNATVAANRDDGGSR